MYSMAVRKILHLDLDAFFCAVEEQINPHLAGKPFAVGGKPEERGVVASCSYPARVMGIRSAMPMFRALSLCPELIIVPSRHVKYSEVSRAVMTHLYDITPLVEQISIDEAFLDVTGRSEPAEHLARALQKTINEEQGLPCSLGVATNKLVAKIANNIGKAEKRSAQPPNAVKIIPPGKESTFLAPLPATELWGVGPKTAERLARLGVATIGDITRIPEAELRHYFGKTGYELMQRAQGIDNRPVTTEHETKSISREITFAQDVTDEHILQRTLLRLSQSVGRRLRRANLWGSTVSIKLRWADFTTVTRQVTLSAPTQHTQDIYHTAQVLFDKNWHLHQPVRLIGVGVSGFSSPVRQLGLWETSEPEPTSNLDDIMDNLRERFGNGAIRRASDLWLDNLSEDE